MVAVSASMSSRSTPAAEPCGARPEDVAAVGFPRPRQHPHRGGLAGAGRRERELQPLAGERELAHEHLLAGVEFAAGVVRGVFEDRDLHPGPVGDAARRRGARRRPDVLGVEDRPGGVVAGVRVAVDRFPDPVAAEQLRFGSDGVDARRARSTAAGRARARSAACTGRVEPVERDAVVAGGAAGFGPDVVRLPRRAPRRHHRDDPGRGARPTIASQSGSACRGRWRRWGEGAARSSPTSASGPPSSVIASARQVRELVGGGAGFVFGLPGFEVGLLAQLRAPRRGWVRGRARPGTAVANSRSGR